MPVMSRLSSDASSCVIFAASEAIVLPCWVTVVSSDSRAVVSAASPVSVSVTRVSNAVTSLDNAVNPLLSASTRVVSSCSAVEFAEIPDRLNPDSSASSSVTACDTAVTSEVFAFCATCVVKLWIAVAFAESAASRFATLDSSVVTFAASVDSRSLS